MINSSGQDNNSNKLIVNNDLSYRIDNLRQIAVEMGDRAAANELAELREKYRTGRPNVVVVGHFKRGKSSLVNSLLGCALAPVGVTPLTAIVTAFEHDPKRSYACIYFQDGHSEETGIYEIGSYVSEEDNPDNQKAVAMVRLFECNLPILQTMTLIDTPGLGSAHLHNTATTQAFIPRIDAALFVLSADLPISESDIAFLEELKKTVPTIFFALNKKDLLSDRDLEKLIGHNRKMIINQVGLRPEDVGIIPVSARLHQHGLIDASNMDTLAVALYSVVQKNDGELLYSALERRIDRLADRLRFLVLASLEALELPIGELKAREKKLLSIPTFLSSRKSDFDHFLTAKTDQLAESTGQAVQKLANDLSALMPGKLSLAEQVFPEDVREYITELDSWILHAFAETRSRLEKEIHVRFQEMIAENAQQPGSFLTELIDSLSEIVQLDFDTIMDKFDLDVYAPFYLSVDDGASPVTRESIIQRRMPLSIRKRRFQRRISDHYKELIVRNAAAVIYNLDYRIQESERKFSAELQHRFHELINQMRKLLNETIVRQAGLQGNIDADVIALTAKLKRIEELKQKPLTNKQPVA